MKKTKSKPKVRARPSEYSFSASNLRIYVLWLAKLAADTPQFYNPFDVMAAKQLRDYVLANQDEFKGG